MPGLGCRFSYDGYDSDDYDLVIISFDGGRGTDNVDTGTDVNIIQDKLAKSDTILFYGTEYSDTLKFDVEIGHVSCDRGVYEISNEERREIEKWLFTNKKFAKFVIDDDEMDGTYYNAILNKPQAVMFNNMCVGYKFTLVNDSSYAYGGTKKINKTDLSDNTELSISNSTDRVGYTYPILRFKPADGVSEVAFTNLSDNSRECRFTGLSPEETITLDCKRQILTSSSGVSRSSCFNKKFLRLVNGKNRIVISGALDSLSLEYDVHRLAGS